MGNFCSDYNRLESRTEIEYKIHRKLKNHADSFDRRQLKKIFFQMENMICKIYPNSGSYGTGFFCKIPFPDYNSYQNSLKVLITNHHILNQKDISPGKNIKISINDEETFLSIDIDKDRLAYAFEKPVDATIIEIKPNDGINGDSFIELDDEVFDENKIQNYIQKTIYLLHYPKGNKVEYSPGKIKNIAIDNYNIEHYCSSEEGSSGGPLINLANFKVIGVHKGAQIEKNSYNIWNFS